MVEMFNFRKREKFGDLNRPESAKTVIAYVFFFFQAIKLY